MKIKKLVIILAATFILAGCGDKEKVISRDNNNASQSQHTDDVKVNYNASTKGYVFKTGDVEIEIEAEAKAYLDALGEPKSYFEAASCAFGDLDKTFTYNGFEINTFSQNGKDYVSAVILRDDTVATKEGICIGASVDKVKEIYGAFTSETDTAIVYAKGNMKLCFFIQDDTVVSIEYLNTILD